MRVVFLIRSPHRGLYISSYNDIVPFFKSICSIVVSGESAENTGTAKTNDNTAAKTTLNSFFMSWFLLKHFFKFLTGPATGPGWGKGPANRHTAGC